MKKKNIVVIICVIVFVIVGLGVKERASALLENRFGSTLEAIANLSSHPLLSTQISCELDQTFGGFNSSVNTSLPLN